MQVFRCNQVRQAAGFLNILGENHRPELLQALPGQLASLDGHKFLFDDRKCPVQSVRVPTDQDTRSRSVFRLGEHIVSRKVGPGNLFVALAKKKVYGDVDIDSIAGPSEVVVIVDSSTRADFTAYDMLAQAEHAPGASILIGWDADALDRALAAIEEKLSTVERGELARQSLEEFGAVILAKDMEETCRLTNLIAPEHLHIATENAEELAEKISCAGAIFLGNHTPVALGDYAAGPSHVLPTSGTARFASGLTCNDFLRANSMLHFDPGGLANLAPDVELLADKEGLTAHRESVLVRMRKG